MFEVATEAMAAQLQSKFGKDLDALWQEVMDYRDKNCMDMTPANRYKSVRQFFYNNTAKKFMDLVWNGVGLWIRNVSFVELWECGFATSRFMDHRGGEHWHGTFQVDQILNGGWDARTLGENVPENLSAKELALIAQSYDPVNGAIREKMKLDIKKLVSCSIYFDIRTGFLLEDFLPKNGGVGNFTAQELTAVILHELGHTLSVIEHAADKFARISTYRYLTTMFQAQNSENAEEAVALATEVTKLVAKKNPENAKKIQDAVIRFKNDLAKAGHGVNPQAKKTLIGALLNITFQLLLDVMIMPFDFLFGFTKRFNPADQKKKAGDIPCNLRLISWHERKADEYAFSHGYGVHQITCLEKLNRLIARFGYNEKDVEKINLAEKLHKDISLMTKLRLIVAAPCLTDDESMYLYPAASKRFKELMYLMVQQLKAHNTDPAWVDKLMADIEVAIKAIENYDRFDEFVAKVQRGYDLLIKYISIPSFYDTLVHGKVLREIEKLVEEIGRLNNNLIYFYGMKFQKLAKGK